MDYDKGFVSGYLAAIQNGIFFNYLQHYHAATLIYETNIPRQEWEEAQEENDFMNEEIKTVLQLAFD